MSLKLCTKAPLVSVVVMAKDKACFNQMREKLVRQSCIKNIEILCLDLKKISICDVHDNKNINPAIHMPQLLNEAVIAANGQYITWMQELDDFPEDKIEKQIEAAVDKSADIVYCCDDFHTEQRNILAELSLNAVEKIGMGAFFVKKEKLLEEKGFDESLVFYSDYDMWRRIIPKCSTYIISNVFYSLTSGGVCETDAAVKEADEICASLLTLVSQEVLKSYELTINLETTYKLYLVKRLYKASSFLLSKLLIMKKTKGESFGYGYLIQQELVGAADSREADNNFKAIQAYENGENKRRVVFYCRGWVTGGVERVLINLLPRLAHKYKVILISDTSAMGRGFALDERVLHINLKYRMPLPIQFRILSLMSFLEAEVFVGTYNQDADFLDIYSYLEEIGIRTIVSNHIYYFLPCYSRTMYPVIPKRQVVYKQASAVTWLTHFNTFLGSMISNNAVVMPNPNTYNQYGDIEEKKEKIILCVGRFFDPIKRIDRILKVFRKVVEQDPEVKLWLVGQYNLEVRIPQIEGTVGELLEKLEFPDETSICWWDEQGDISDFYKKASILMMTSDNEGFGMVLSEAGMKGCPGIIMEIPGLDDIIIDAENGYIVPQDDVEGMAKKIVLLFQKPEILKSMQDKALKYSKRFDQRVIAERWIKLIEGLCNIRDKGERDAYLQNNFGYSREREKEFIKYAIPLYNKEIKHAMYTVNLQKLEVVKSEENQAELKSEALNRKFSGCGDNKEILKQYELYLGSQIKRSGETVVKKILESLPLNDNKKIIGIYGTGKNTDRLLERYKELVGKIEAKIVFIDSNKISLVEKYRGVPIYNVRDIANLSLHAIIVSSILYEENMVKTIEKLYGNQYKIYRFYDKVPVDFLG